MTEGVGLHLMGKSHVRRSVGVWAYQYPMGCIKIIQSTHPELEYCVEYEITDAAYCSTKCPAKIKYADK